MQRHLSMSKRGPLIWSLTFVATHVPAALAQEEAWTDEHANALVLIGTPPSVVTGFIVEGLGRRQYVATSTHGLLPELTEEQAQALPVGCSPLPDTKLQQGNSGGPGLQAKCAYHIGNDVSLVELHPGTSPWPVLPFLACDLAVGDEFYLGGFTRGGERLTQLPGKIRGKGPQGMLMADSLTEPGLRGGPYLTADGDVVAIHRGEAQYTAGYADLVPVLTLRTKLDALLPTTKKSGDCPKPVSYDDVIQRQLDHLTNTYLGMPFGVDPETTLAERIEGVERYITLIRKEIQWNMTIDENRVDTGPILTINYRRLVPGEEQPPATDMVLTITQTASPDVQLKQPQAEVYSLGHTEEINGQSGRYEVFLLPDLKKMAATNKVLVQAIRADLRYREQAFVLLTRLFTLEKPIPPS